MDLHSIISYHPHPHRSLHKFKKINKKKYLKKKKPKKKTLCHSQEKPSRDRWGHGWRASPVYTAPDTSISCTISYRYRALQPNSSQMYNQVETKAVISQHNSCCGHMNNQLKHITIHAAFSATSITINSIKLINQVDNIYNNNICT